MDLPIYVKELNRDSFRFRHYWEIRRGWYNDGENQFIVEFEPVTSISTFNKRYYRFPRFGDKHTHMYYWLILTPKQSIRFSIIQNGVFKSLIPIVREIVHMIIQLF